MSNRKNPARRDKAWHKKQADQVLIQLSRERNELWRMKRDAPLIKLDQPYQRGWVRYFTLTEEAMRRKDSHRFRALLEYVQNIQYSHNCQFMIKRFWKSKRVRPRKHRLKILNVYLALKFKMPENLLAYLVTQKRRPISTRERLRELLLSGYNGQIKVRHPHYFVRVVEPFMITHQRVALPEVERRLAEVEFILDQPQHRGRLKTLQCSRSYAWKQVDEERENRRSDRASMKDLELALLEYHMEHRSITQERVVTPPSLFYFFHFFIRPQKAQNTQNRD